MTEAPFDHSTFSKNRERLLKHDVAQEFFHEIVAQTRTAQLMSSEHFIVDGTLIEAWRGSRRMKKHRRSAISGSVRVETAGAGPKAAGVERRGELSRREALDRVGEAVMPIADRSSRG